MGRGKGGSILSKKTPEDPKQQDVDQTISVTGNPSWWTQHRLLSPSKAVVTDGSGVDGGGGEAGASEPVLRGELALLQLQLLLVLLNQARLRARHGELR